MAIDTAEKRRSVAGLPFHPLGVGVTPNASKDIEWRQQAGWGYSGIAATVVVIALVGRWENAAVVSEKQRAVTVPMKRRAVTVPMKNRAVKSE
jgi:hypothetical protein